MAYITRYDMGRLKIGLVYEYDLQLREELTPIGSNGALLV